MKPKTTWTFVIVAALVALLIALGMVLPFGAWIESLVAWIRNAGALGLIVYAVVLVAFSVLLLPTVELYIAAGLIWGTWAGAAITTVLTLVSAVIAFGLTRTGLRRRIAKKIKRNAKLSAIDRGIADRSFSIALLLRVSPIVPFGPLNYALAATKMSLSSYLWTTALGMLPDNLLFAYAGSLLRDVTQLGEATPGPWKQIALWGGIAAAVAASILVGIVVKHALERTSRRHARTH
ncbi:MAG: associated Golgi protein-like protein [Myxococcales bacterium]|nr:associated Golgi protein-like protein [Myxococcales bacterium]